jgi:DNA (cytosine-5)-methyltransferase 1
MTPLVQLDGDSELDFTDIFCGAGGSSIGLSEAGFRLKLAANHWDRAIETHAANFRDAEHLCADVSNYDWRRAPRTVVGWFSPECTWHSPAGGRKRARQQLDLFEEHVPDEAGVRSRATAFDVIRAMEVHRYRAVIVENVTEFADWELFDWWLEGLRKVGKGYNVQTVCVSSAHIGGDGNPHAPQWRDRLYLVATQKGIPLPDVAPRPPAWCPVCDEVTPARQTWKKVTGRRVGKYGSQYVYTCGNGARCRHQVVEPYVLPASAAIDWSDLGTRIGDRPRPLAAATMRRIRVGLELFAQPVVAKAHGQTWERPGSGYVRAWPALEAPLMSRVSTPGDGVATPPFAVTLTHGKDDHGRHFLFGEAPLPTRSTKTGDGIVVPPGAFGVTLRNHGEAFPLGTDALSTVSTARHDGMVVPPGAFIQKHHGGLEYGPIGHMTKDVREPMPVVVAKPNLSLVIPYRRGANPRPAEATALPAVSTKESAGLLDTAVDVEDCRFRMLKPREHLAAQRFPGSYVVTGNQGEQTMQAGNAVSCNVAAWLGRQLRTVLG